MKKAIIISVVMLSMTFCKGPGSGPLVNESFSKEEMKDPMEGMISSGPAKTEKINIKIEPCEGCIKIADLMANKKSYAGKVIKIKGQVVRYNPGIMGKNWVHIQDGSEFNGEFDLTITTSKNVSVGDLISFEGKIALDKDFGYGYFYNILLEEAISVQQ
jgi:hypothetical protein